MNRSDVPLPWLWVGARRTPAGWSRADPRCCILQRESVSGSCHRCHARRVYASSQYGISQDRGKRVQSLCKCRVRVWGLSVCHRRPAWTTGRNRRRARPQERQLGKGSWDCNQQRATAREAGCFLQMCSLMRSISVAFVAVFVVSVSLKKRGVALELL